MMLRLAAWTGDLVAISAAAALVGWAGLPPALAVGAWLVAVVATGAHRGRRLNRSRRIVAALLRAGLVAAGLTAVLQVALDVGSGRGLWMGIALPLVALLAWRLVFFRLQAVFTARHPTRVIVVGVGPDGDRVAERVQSEAGRPWVVVGRVRADGEAGDADGELGDLPDLVRQSEATVVLLAVQLGRQRTLDLASWGAREGIEVLQAPLGSGLVSPRLEGVELGRVELVRLGDLRYPETARLVKRAFDLVAVLLGGLLLLPLLLGVAVLVKLQDGGPVLYVSQRAGQWGEAFPFFKFRSMRVDADAQKQELPNEADGPLFKMSEDPRITTLGRFLRRWSIDELPQLLNVLRGDMNLVGPRPLPMGDLEGIERDPEHWYWFQQRCRVKPGITGPWQVAGRSDLPFEAMVDLDVYYIQNWSLLLDVQILLRTIPAVLRGRGAR